MQENLQNPEAPQPPQEPQAKPETKKLSFAARVVFSGLKCIFVATILLIAIAVLIPCPFGGGAPRSEHDAWLAKQAMIAQAAELASK